MNEFEAVENYLSELFNVPLERSSLLCECGGRGYCCWCPSPNGSSHWLLLLLPPIMCLPIYRSFAPLL